MKRQQELWMSQRERDRLQVLHEAKKGHLTQKQAGAQLKLSERWVRKLVARLRKEGDGGILHRLRGRASKRKLPEAVRAQVVRLVKREYTDFGPTLAAEYLGEKHGVAVSKESVRQILMEAGVWKRKRRRVEEVHVWRARRPCCGEMAQWDSSEHDWLEGRGPKLYLMAMLDDATSRALARFAEHDTTEENFFLLESYLKRWGRPGEYYTDKDSMFTVNRPVREADDEAWPEALTQIGRALKELGTGWIAAHSPQAKGRIERFFGTAQDRLVKGLRKAGAHTLAEANAYLEQEYLPMWNRRFTVEAENATDAHRPLRAGHDLAAILSHVEERVVANDYTIRYNTKIYQITRADIRPGLRGATVRVEERRDQTVWVRFRDRYLEVSRCEPVPQQTRPAPSASVRPISMPRRGTPGSPWMKDFHLGQSPPLWNIIKREQGAERVGGSTP
jgi:transposase